MSDAVWGQGVLTRAGGGGERWGPRSVLLGRHAVDEDAALTPIFHALARAGWGSRAEHVGSRDAAVVATVVAVPAEADPVEAFHRDPLAAPLPASGPVEDGESRVTERPAGGRRRAGAHAVPEVRRGGRHHRRLVPLDGGAAED